MSTTTAPITIPRTFSATRAAASVQPVRSARLSGGRMQRVAQPCTRRHGLPMTVSAMSFDVDGEVRAMVRPKVPNYAMRRMLVGATAVLALVFGLLGAVGLAAGVSASTASAAPATDVIEVDAPTVHVVRAGDTMWSIAETYRGSVDHGRYLDALITTNGGVSVQTGAAVQLP